MSEATGPYVIRLGSGEWYQGKNEEGAPSWTRVPRWAHRFTDPVELAPVLEWLEETDQEYSLLTVR